MDKSDNLKDYLLMFDNLTIEHGPIHLVEKLMGVLPNGKQDFKEKLEYLEFLENKGLIEILNPENFEIPHELMTSPQFVFNYSKSVEYYSKIKGIKERTKGKGVIDIYAEFMENDRTAGEFSSRYRSIVLNHKNPSSEYIPIVRNFAPKYLNEVDTNKSLVLGVVLKNFPIIESNVDIDRIIEFKQVDEIRARYFN